MAARLPIRRQEHDAPAPKIRRIFGFTTRQHLIALGVFAVVTLAFFFPLVQGDTFSDVAARQQQTYPWAGATNVGDFQVLHFDQDDSNYPWQVFMNRELRDGHLPLWNPYSFGGAPFFANGQSGVLYPPRLALAATVSPARVHDFLLATHLFLAGVEMFLLLGFAGLSFPAAVVGGLAWMLNSFGLSWQALEHYTAIEVYLPIATLLAHAVVRRRSWLAAYALGSVLGLLFTAGNALFVELAVAATLGYAVVLALVDARSQWSRLGGTAARLGVGVGLGLGLAAISILPTVALAGDSARASLTFGQLGDFALSWSDLAYVFKPPPDAIKFDPYHHDLFAGTAVGVLALIGCLRRETLARFAAVLGVLTILFMLHTPVTYVVIRMLPGFDNFKPLSRAAFLLQFALAVLAAFGLDTLLRRLATRSVRMPRRLPRVWPGLPVAGILIGLVAASIVVQEWRWKEDVMRHQPAGRQYLYPPTPLVQALQKHPQARFLPTNPAFRGSTAMVFSLESAGGYESLLPSRTQNFWRVVGDGIAPGTIASTPVIYAYHPTYELSRLKPRRVAQAGVQYVVSPPAAVEGFPVPAGLRLRYDRPDGRIFSVDGALPRAYVVGACEEVGSPFSALERFVAADFKAGDAVILEERDVRRDGASCPGGASGRAGTASIVRSSPMSLLVFVRARRAGWLVVNDSWDKGWKANVDGREAELLPANYALRAVRLTAGEHWIKFTYEPPLFRLGATVSAFSLGAVLGGFVLVWWRRRRRH